MPMKTRHQGLRSLKRNSLPRRGLDRQTRLGHFTALYSEPLEERALLSWSTFTVPSNVVPSGVSNMMLLSDGTVMAHGAGLTNTWYSLTPVNGSYTNGTWSPLPSMSVSRQFFPSAVLPNGNVFVLGGEFASDQNFSRSAEIFNTATKTWIPGIAAVPPLQFGDVPIEVLPDGRVLAGDLFTSNTYIYNPATNTWSGGASKFYSDASDEESWVKLPDGSILTYDCQAQLSQNKFLAERYIPAPNGPGTWVDASNLDPSNPPDLLTSTSRELGGAVLLPNGDVFITGNQYATFSVGNTALYHSSTNTWSAGPTIVNSVGGGDLPMAVMPNGHVLVAEYGNPFPATGIQFWEYDPTNAAQPYTLQTPPAPFTTTNYPYMLVLPSGQVLMSDESNALFVYTPVGAPNPAWAPTITNITNDTGSNVFTLSGYQLNGISEGATYGDDAMMSSNYPIVRLTDRFGTVTFARTFNWSTTGVREGFSTVNFTLPPGQGLGAYLVNVIANGIASATVLNIQCSSGGGESFTMQANANANYTDIALTGGPVVATFYIGAFNALIMTGDAASNTLVINDNFFGRPTTLNGGNGNDFLRVENNGTGTVTENGGGGDDYFDFSFYAGNLSNTSNFTYVYGGGGFDYVWVYDNNNANNNTYTIDSAELNRAGFGGFFYGADVEALTFTSGNGNDTVNVPSTYAATPVYL